MANNIDSKPNGLNANFVQFSMGKNIIHKRIPKGINYSYHRQVSIAHHSSTYLYDNVAIYVQCREKLASS